MSKKFGFDTVAGKMGRRGWRKSNTNKVRNIEKKSGKAVVLKQNK